MKIMNWMTSFHALTLTAVASMAIGLSGCNKDQVTTGDTADAVSTEDGHGHGHDGWWCAEHGVPEEICAQCDKSLVAEFKANDDWCEDHNRPESQCFICSPKRAEKFIAQYEAKEGKKPPQPEEE